MLNQRLLEYSQPQRNRLAFIELRIRFVGEIRRQDLVARFDIKSAAATRDMALYKELAPGNIDYDSKGKSYVLGAQLSAHLYFHAQTGCCPGLTQGFGDGEPQQFKAWVLSESPSRLTLTRFRCLGQYHACNTSEMPSSRQISLYYQRRYGARNCALRPYR